MLYLPNYAAAFRCIGQELQSQDIEVFEVRSHADEFRLQCGDPSPPYTRIMEMSFSKENIEMIDREMRRRRGQSTGEIRFDSIPEILRAVGEYLDKKGSYLRRVTNSGASPEATFELEYQTRAGEIEREFLTMSFVRETCVRMYQRRTAIKDPINLITRRR